MTTHKSTDPIIIAPTVQDARAYAREHDLENPRLIGQRSTTLDGVPIDPTASVRVLAGCHGAWLTEQLRIIGHNKKKTATA